jgi:uncharacterized protein
MITDCHTHYGIPWVDRDGDNPEKWLAIPKKHGVEKFFLFGHYNIYRENKTKEDNDRLARITKKYPEHFTPVATVWPQNGQGAIDEMVRCIEILDFPLLKFHPWIQGFSLTHPTMKQIYALAGEYQVPIIFHDGTPCYSLPEQIAGLARQFHKTTFVLGHGGILWAWRSALEAMKHPNIWTMLCGSTMQAYEIFCEKSDTDRLLWGSDYGFGLSDSVGYRLHELQQAKIKPTVIEKILSVNPSRFLEMKK